MEWKSNVDKSKVARTSGRPKPLRIVVKNRELKNCDQFRSLKDVSTAPKKLDYVLLQLRVLLSPRIDHFGQAI